MLHLTYMSCLGDTTDRQEHAEVPYVYGTGSTDESVSIVRLWPLLTPPVGVNRHCVFV